MAWSCVAQLQVARSHAAWLPWIDGMAHDGAKAERCSAAAVVMHQLSYKVSRKEFQDSLTLILRMDPPTEKTVGNMVANLQTIWDLLHPAHLLNLFGTFNQL